MDSISYPPLRWMMTMACVLIYIYKKIIIIIKKTKKHDRIMFYFGYIIYFIVTKNRCCILNVYCIIYYLYYVFYYSSPYSVFSVSFWMVPGSTRAIALLHDNHIVNSHDRNYILSRFLSSF
jgi:hypothetical protein